MSCLVRFKNKAIVSMHKSRVSTFKLIKWKRKKKLLRNTKNLRKVNREETIGAEELVMWNNRLP